MPQSRDRFVWESAQRAVIAGDVSALERLLRDNPELHRGLPPPYVQSGPGPRYDTDARSIIAREHRFESYAAFDEHRAMARDPNSPLARFEAAVDAIVTGDLAALERLLRDDPRLIDARSARGHHATLLHYVGANGVEGFRQQTPPNAVAITRTLLDAGAAVDAVADMYGGSTSLDLVATSIHPLRAGVQIALLEALLAAGATIDGRHGSIVNGCLANGRGDAAAFLAGRGARLDLEGAAGVGRLDIVRSYFDGDGRLQGAASEQLRSGFAWASEFGRTEVVDFLLQRGVAADTPLKHNGQTALHWAAYGARVETVRLLLRRNAPVNAKDESFAGTPLGWTLYGWGEQPPGATRDGYYEVAALLSAAGGTVAPDWLDAAKRGIPLERMVRADARMVAALGAAWCA
jgi:ankyrin repeat protein